MGKEVDCQIGGVGKNRKLVTSNLGQGLTAKLQEGHSGLRLAEHFTKSESEEKMPMNTKLWRRLRSAYAPYQQSLISLGDLLRNLQQKKYNFLLNNESLFLRL